MEHDFQPLVAFLARMPALDVTATPDHEAKGVFANGNWWIKFTIDTGHPLAWRHVQELGHVLNYIAVDERLPTVFMPVSPPPYMNGGVEFLAWVIESTRSDFSPAQCAEWLEARLPDPVDDLAEWDLDS